MSKANTTDTETDTESTDTSTDFSVEAVRGRLSGTLTGKQERVGVCLVRNPDAPLTGISNKAGVSPTTVHNTLKALVNERGLDETDVAEAFARRGGPKRAKSYDELTEKQKAVVDWAARNPGTRERVNDPEDSLTSEKVSLAIEHDERYDVALHSTYPGKVLKPETYDHAGGYAALVDERRETLAAKGELDEEAEAEVAETLRTKPPRALLEAAGWDLPEVNRDSLDEADELTEQERLDKAWEAGQNKDEEEPVTEADRREHSAPYSCPECGNEGNEDYCSKCGADKRYEWAKADEESEEDEDLADGERDEDFSEEVSEPLVQDAEALEDALEGMTERLNKLRTSVDTLRESAVHETELEEVLANLESRLQSALTEHKEEVNEEVDERLHNSVKRETLDRVETLEERVRAVEAAEESTPEEPRVMADGHLDANTRLSLVLNELVGLAESGAEVTSMEVQNRRGGNREYVITVSEDGESGPQMARDEAAGEGED